MANMNMLLFCSVCLLLTFLPIVVPHWANVLWKFDCDVPLKPNEARLPEWCVHIEVGTYSEHDSKLHKIFTFVDCTWDRVFTLQPTLPDWSGYHQFVFDLHIHHSCGGFCNRILLNATATASAYYHVSKLNTFEFKLSGLQDSVQPYVIEECPWNDMDLFLNRTKGWVQYHGFFDWLQNVTRRS